MRKQLTALLLCVLLILAACGKPNTWEGNYELGARYLSEGNYAEAILAFTAAIEIDPRQAVVYAARASAYCFAAEDDETQYELAEADYLTALELESSAVDVYRELAEFYYDQGRKEEAIEILERGEEATGDEFLHELLTKYRGYEEVAVTGEIFLIRDEYEDSINALIESLIDSIDGNFGVVYETFGIRFDTPLEVMVEGSPCSISLAEFQNPGIIPE